MPATYSHHYTWEQIQKMHYSKRNQPRDDIGPKEYRIFGYEVDAATHKKFNRKDYRVGFGFNGLMIVELWATDPYYEKEYPEEAAKAKAIMADIITQITGKEQKNMKEPRTAADFIAALNEIYTESRASYDALQAKVDNAKARMDRAYAEMKDPGCKNQQLAQVKYDVAKGEYTLAEDARRGDYLSMQREHEEKVAELRVRFEAYLNDHYAASPDKLDAATMQLLNAGICTPSELARLVDRHADNPTMLRIVGNYARNMREEKGRTMSINDQRICTTVAQMAHAAKDGSRELAIFDSAVSAAAYGLGKEYVHATRMHSLVSGWMDDFKNQIMNMSWKPAETAGATGTGDASGSDE